MSEYRMPSLGADMKAATLVEWKVKPGDKVQRGDIIAELETEKGDIDVEVFEDGIIDQIIAQPGSKLPVGTVLAIIQSENEELKKSEIEPLPDKLRIDQPITSTISEQPPMQETLQRKPEEHHVRASPLARKIASELHIDLAQVQGTGPGGAIERADVERTAARIKRETKPAQDTEPEVVQRPEGMRNAIAAAMSRSNREIPHYYLQTHIDMHTALRWLENKNKERSINERILPVAILIKAVTKSLNDVPELNGFWRNEQLEIQDAIHIGIAISLRQTGLVIPAIHNVDLKNLDEIMNDLRDLTLRARSGHLKSSELTDGTVTITNLGDRGVELVHGVIYPPQVALIGFGKITESPWAINGMLTIRPILNATLAADHRATDGHKGALFLEKLTYYLQESDHYE